MVQDVQWLLPLVVTISVQPLKWFLWPLHSLESVPGGWSSGDTMGMAVGSNGLQSCSHRSHCLWNFVQLPCTYRTTEIFSSSTVTAQQYQCCINAACTCMYSGWLSRCMARHQLCTCEVVTALTHVHLCWHAVRRARMLHVYTYMYIYLYDCRSCHKYCWCCYCR